jgi:hypothetical protein
MFVLAKSTHGEDTQKGTLNNVLVSTEWHLHFAPPTPQAWQTLRTPCMGRCVAAALARCVRVSWHAQAAPGSDSLTRGFKFPRLPLALEVLGSARNLLSSSSMRWATAPSAPTLRGARPGPLAWPLGLVAGSTAAPFDEACKQSPPVSD